MERGKHVLVSDFSLLEELLRCFLQLGKICLSQGAVKEAKRYFVDGKDAAGRFLSANRWVFVFSFEKIYLTMRCENFPVLCVIFFSRYLS